MFRILQEKRLNHPKTSKNTHFIGVIHGLISVQDIFFEFFTFLPQGSPHSLEVGGIEATENYL